MRFFFFFSLFALAAPAAYASCVLDLESETSTYGAYLTEGDCRPSLARELISGFVIQGFDLEFANGDHKPKVFGVFTPSGPTTRAYRSADVGPININLRDPRLVIAVLSDPDGEDPLRGEIRLLPYRFAATGEVTRDDCSGTCIIPINQPRPEGTTLALRGFLLSRHAGFDDNIRNVQIAPQCTNGACHYKVGFEDNDTRETFTATIQYAFVPDEGSRFFESFGGPERNFGELREQGGTTHDALSSVLTSFQLRFDSDRKLGRVAVMPNGNQSGEIVMRDGGDDGSRPNVRWYLQYTVVRPSDLLMR